MAPCSRLYSLPRVPDYILGSDERVVVGEVTAVADVDVDTLNAGEVTPRLSLHIY
jgi:hypothetical protein